METRPQTKTAHGARTYLPLPKSERRGVALCLSGGGFRAALFHLGALRRLNELGILAQLRTITAVSGGSTIAAHLAARLSSRDTIDPAAWETEIAAPFREFASKNLSAVPVAIGWVFFWTDLGVTILARRCDERLKLTPLKLRDLPEHPRFVFCTVDLAAARGYPLDTRREPSWSLGTAVAASSCFPGYFRPLREKQPHRVALVDGGVEDNRGVEPVWRDHRTILVSDGGDVLRPTWSRSLFWLMRSAYVLWKQSQDIRKRWLLSNFMLDEMAGAYWGIESSTVHYVAEGGQRVNGYSTALARDVIATIRTDYDAFSEAEAAVLENHGYLLAEAATLTHLSTLRPHPERPLMIPHPAWVSEQKIREALNDSSKKRPFGRW